MIITNLLMAFMFAVILISFGVGAIPPLIVIGVIATFQKDIKLANELIITTFIWLFISYGLNVVPALITIAFVATFREEKRVSIAAAAIWGVFVVIYLLNKHFSFLYLMIGFILLLCVIAVGWGIRKFWKLFF